MKRGCFNPTTTGAECDPHHQMRLWFYLTGELGGFSWLCFSDILDNFSQDAGIPARQENMNFRNFRQLPLYDTVLEVVQVSSCESQYHQRPKIPAVVGLFVSPLVEQCGFLMKMSSPKVLVNHWHLVQWSKLTNLSVMK